MPSVSRAGFRSRLALGVAAALAACAKQLPPRPPEPFAVATPRAVPFVGCWRLHLDHPLDQLGMSDRLTVRLDSTMVEPGSGEAGLQAVAVAGFDGKQAPRDPRLVWWVHAESDTLEIGTVSLSGAAWRLAGAGDSLAGETRLFFDLGGTDSVVGAVTARRARCDT